MTIPTGLHYSIDHGPNGPLVYVEQLPDDMPFPVNREQGGDWQRGGIVDRDGTRVRLHFANGDAVYELGEYPAWADEVWGHLISWECTL